MNFLIELGVNKEIVDYLENTLSNQVIYAININEDNIKKNYRYLKQIGIRTVDDFLIRGLEELFVDNKTFKDTINKFGKDDFIEKINDSSDYIDMVF